MIVFPILSRIPSRRICPKGVRSTEFRSTEFRSTEFVAVLAAVLAAVLSAAPRCEAATALLLQKNRVEVSLEWKNQRDGTTGVGSAGWIGDNFGSFALSDPASPELFVKILDRGPSQPFLLFHGGHSDLEYHLTFRNRCTGKKVVVDRAGGVLQGGVDGTGMEVGCEAGPRLSPEEKAIAAAAPPEGAGGKGARASRVPLPGQRLVLSRGRVEVSLKWRNQYDGSTGSGRAIPSSDGLGFFAFADPSNPEVVVKVQDRGPARPLVLLHAALTSLEYEVTYRDTCGAETVVLLKPADSMAAGADDGAMKAPCEAAPLVVTVAGSTAAPGNILLNLGVASRTGEPVVDLQPSAVTFREEGETGVVDESNGTLFPGSLNTDRSTLLLLDLSGGVTAETLEKVIEGARQLAWSLLAADHEVSVWYFQTGVVRVQEFTNDPGALDAALEGLRRQVVPGASSNLNGALVAGISALSSMRARAGRARSGTLVVFSAGGDLAAVKTQAQAQAAAKASPVSVYVVALKGPRLDRGALEGLAKTAYLEAATPGELPERFGEVAAAVEAQGRSSYLFVFCSPKRAGKHSVELTLKDSLGRTGKATYAFDADGFADGCWGPLEALRLQFWDLDGDGWYRAAGPKHDCDDDDPYNWISCATCRDADGDGYRGTGCDVNVDCNDADPKIHPGAKDRLGDGIDQDCSGLDGPDFGLNLPGKPPVPMLLARIPGGTFRMGSPPSERGRGNDEMLHQVTLSSDFLIGQLPVTQEQWQAVMGAPMSVECGGWGTGPEYPAYCLSWKDVAGPGGFLEKLNAYLKESRQAGAFKVRLPTEAEWERAARGDASSQQRFGFGDALEGDDACGANGSAEPNTWWCGNNKEFGIKPAGEKKPNAFGLHDMSGNVSEWVQDWYAGFTPFSETNPKGPASGARKVLRGGNWNSALRGCRSAARDSALPDVRSYMQGFRVARSM